MAQTYGETVAPGHMAGDPIDVEFFIETGG